MGKLVQASSIDIYFVIVEGDRRLESMSEELSTNHLIPIKIEVVTKFDHIAWCRCVDCHLVIGGAYSVDKYYRLENDLLWFADEQPSAEIKTYVEDQITKNRIDIVLSHTYPYKSEPRDAFLPMLDQSTVDDSTERWLDGIEEKVDYKARLCGHCHIEKQIDKLRILFHDV